MENKKYLMDIKNFSKSWDRIDEYQQIKLRKKYRRIVLCGMGGSSSFAHLVNQMLGYVTDNRIQVIKDYMLPRFVTDEDLVIISSYSGNTEESISCFHEALSKGLDIVAFAAGGELTELAQEHDIPLYRLPTGFQPRMGLPYQVCALASILVHNGWVSQDFVDEMVSAGKAIGNYNIEEAAKDVIPQIKNSVIVLYSTSQYQHMCRIIKIKFNENAKTQSFYNVFPEMNHNEMQGYEKLVGNYTILEFTDKHDHPRNKQRQEVTAQMLAKKGIKTIQIPLQGKNYMEKVFYGIHCGDFLTYYLAIQNNIDPEPVHMVEEFKKLLG